MTIEQARRFVKRVAGREIKVRYSNDPLMQDFAGWCDGTKIELSRKHFMYRNEVFQKALLMHEVGHLSTSYYFKHHARELYSHLWAIKKANSLGWNRIKRELINAIKSWSNGSFTWNEDKGIHRKYIIASKNYRSMKGPKNGKSR
jgi:hypothetical protein